MPLYFRTEIPLPAWHRPWSPGGVRLGRGYEHGTAEFLVDMQRVPVTRNPRESDHVGLAHGAPARRHRPIQRELLKIERRLRWTHRARPDEHVHGHRAHGPAKS